MKRFAFKMFLKPGCEKEYAKRHAAIWPELVKMIKGIYVIPITIIIFFYLCRINSFISNTIYFIRN